MKFKNRKQYTACGLASAAVAPNCANPIIGNIEPVFWLANKSEVSGFAITAGVCTAITRVATKVFYPYETFRTGNVGKGTADVGKYTTLFSHEFSTIIWKLDGATLLQLEALAKGQVVLMVEYKYKGTAGETAFKIFGKDQGLEVSVMEMDSSDGDTKGAVKVTFKTPNGGQEGNLPTPFYTGGTYAATAAAVTALTV